MYPLASRRPVLDHSTRYGNAPTIIDREGAFRRKHDTGRVYSKNAFTSAANRAGWSSMMKWALSSMRFSLTLGRRAKAAA